MQDWQTQGRHRYRIDADFVHWQLQGPVSVDDLRVMFDVWEQVTALHGAPVTLMELGDGVSVSPQARRYVSERTRTAPITGTTAIVGASRVLRTVVQLLHNASRLLGRTLPPALFADTVEEAQAMLARARKDLPRRT